MTIREDDHDLRPHSAGAEFAGPACYGRRPACYVCFDLSTLTTDEERKDDEKAESGGKDQTRHLFDGQVYHAPTQHIKLVPCCRGDVY